MDRSRFSGKMVASAQKTNRRAQVLAPRGVGFFFIRIDLGSMGYWLWNLDRHFNGCVDLNQCYDERKPGRKP